MGVAWTSFRKRKQGEHSRKEISLIFCDMKERKDCYAQRTSGIEAD
jgi:hypothetical protein